MGLKERRIGIVKTSISMETRVPTNTALWEGWMVFIMLESSVAFNSNGKKHHAEGYQHKEELPSRTAQMPYQRVRSPSWGAFKQG